MTADRDKTTPRAVLLVFLGGTLGVLLRAVISDKVAVDSVFPVATFAINLVGAFALAVLVEAGTARSTRLFLGTGLIGGFTTYSALAVQTDVLLRNDHVGVALAYAVGTVVLGFVASIAGITVTRLVRRS